VDALLSVEKESDRRENCIALAKSLGAIDDLEYLRQLLATDTFLPPIARDMISLRIGMLLTSLKKYEEVVQIYAGLFERAGQPANVRRWYTAALVRAGRYRKALDLLLPADRSTNIDIPSRNTIILLAFSESSGREDPLEDVYSRLDAAKPSHTQLKYVLGREARRRRRFDWVARLLGDVYHQTERPRSLVEPYINALLLTKQHQKAAGELEDVIRSGYHTPWAFESLSDTYLALEKDKGEVLRAITGEIELHPGKKHPKARMAKYWGKLGDVRREVDLMNEVIREILEEE
ncbi:hypothetical protein ACFL01_02910, partial [Planctomycetota bacterium]